jgi:hypothetical protein
MLNGCVNVLVLEEGMYVHEHILQSGCDYGGLSRVACLTCMEDVGAWRMLGVILQGAILKCGHLDKHTCSA